jgi:cytochrome P450
MAAVDAALMGEISAMNSETLPLDVAQTLVDPRAYADMPRLHAAYSWARANNPLGRAVVDGFDPFWVVTKHADVMYVGRNNDLFHNADRSTVLFDQATLQHIRTITGGDPNLVRSLVQMDDPDHRKMRALTQAWFMPASIAKLEDNVREIARSEIDAMAALGGECDFINKVALGYPLHVVMEILGVPREDEPRMLKLTQEIFGPEDPELNRSKQDVLTAEQRADMLNAVVADFGAYFKTITEERRVHPRNDVATVLANALLDGEPLSDRYLTSYYIIIAAAGHDTTSSSIGTAMWALCQFPDLLPRLKADLSLIPAFIDEAVRWATPVRHFMRSATADTELRGRRIAKGDWLMLCYWSANRDDDVFDQPFEFRLNRKPNTQIAFGYGRHMCLGMHLARLEMRRLFEELLPRLESVEAAGPMELVAATFVGGPKRLPIRFRMS